MCQIFDAEGEFVCKITTRGASQCVAVDRQDNVYTTDENRNIVVHNTLAQSDKDICLTSFKSRLTNVHALHVSVDGRIFACDLRTATVNVFAFERARELDFSHVTLSSDASSGVSARAGVRL